MSLKVISVVLSRAGWFLQLNAVLICSSASAAEVLFASLKDRSVRACCSMIRGYAKVGFLLLFNVSNCTLCCCSE